MNGFYKIHEDPPVLMSPSGRKCACGSPAGRVLSRLARGDQLLFIGASTPFRSSILANLGHHDVWLGSLELSALMGCKDNDVIGAEPFLYAADSMRATCNDINIFVDCDAAWSDDVSHLRKIFNRFSSNIAAVSIQNVVIGTKQNSFLSTNGSRLATPHVVSRRLHNVAQSCKNVLVVLRLENDIVGQTDDEIDDYLGQLKVIQAPFDMAILHHKKGSMDRVHKLSELFYRHFSRSIPLAAIPTSYMRELDMRRKLKNWNYMIVIIPNYALRFEYDVLSRIYQDIINDNFSEIDKQCSTLSEVLSFMEKNLRNESMLGAQAVKKYSPHSFLSKQNRALSTMQDIH